MKKRHSIVGSSGCQLLFFSVQVLCIPFQFCWTFEAPQQVGLCRDYARIAINSAIGPIPMILGDLPGRRDM